MARDPYIFDLGDTDLYKLTMLKWVIDHYSEARVRYELKVRRDVPFTAKDEKDIKQRIKEYGQAKFSEACLTHLNARSPFLGTEFLTYLKGVKLNPDEVHFWRDEHGYLRGVAEGIWAQTILWEIVCLSVISEVYFANHHPALDDEQKRRIYEDAKSKGCEFLKRKCYLIEMGTRRRYSQEVQRLVLRGLIDGASDPDTGVSYLLGTSNVMFAAEFGVNPQGTMAHEIFSAVAAMAGVENANNVVLGKWANTYHGLLGVALPDTFTTAFFLRTFNPFYANLYNGLRHDSHQEPNVWTDMVLDHLQKLGVDTRAKRLVYSDGINSFERVDAILNHRKDECMKSFGIGTWLTNDLKHINGAEALNVVMKLIAAQKNAYEPMYHACKLSDVDGKETGDLVTIAEYRRKIDNAHPVPPIKDIIPGTLSRLKV